MLLPVDLAVDKRVASSLKIQQHDTRETMMLAEISYTLTGRDLCCTGHAAPNLTRTALDEPYSRDFPNP